MKTLKYIFILLFCYLSSSAVSQDNQGTDFWLMFTQNYIGSTDLNLYISSETNTSGVVDLPAIGFNQAFTTTAGVVTTINLPATAQQNGSGLSNLGIHITSEDDITVYGFNVISFSTDAFMALPTDALGSEYLVLTYNALSDLASQIGIVGAESGTTSVTITPSVNSTGGAAGVPFNINLEQGETYVLKNVSNGQDLTGTSVVADKNIAVFAGVECANVPVGTFYCDHLVEQVPPLSSWGTEFVNVPLSSRTGGDTYRFLAQEDNTEIFLNGVSIAVLDIGEFHEQIIDGFNSITASNPILLGQYSNGSSFDGAVADPFLLYVPPSEQFLTDYLINAGTSNITNNYINLVSETSNVGFVSVDGVIVDPSEWTAIAGSDFSGAQISILDGQHSVSSDFPVGVFVYGFGSFDSYGYLGAQSFSPVATVSSLEAGPSSQEVFLGDEVCIDAEVKDQFDMPVVGVKVDFNVSGSNSFSGFSLTDENGMATFCYTPANPGMDMVEASIGSLTSTVEVTIQECNLEVEATITEESCYNANDGSIDISLSNFGEITDISWSNGEATEDLSGLTGGDYSVTINYDNDCVFEMTYTVGTYLENDADCDNVDDSCDVCPGGDDTVDNNGDGLPDCKYLPAKEDIITEWKCGNQLRKIFICHIPPGNPANAMTKCVGYNSVPAHLAHGDYVGPCGNADCDEGIILPERPDDFYLMETYPNPATDELFVEIETADANSKIQLIDLQGNVLYSIQTTSPKGVYKVDLSSLGIYTGLYFISLQSNDQKLVKKIIVK